MTKLAKITAVVLAVVIAFAGVAIWIYADDYYRAEDVGAYMSSGDGVSVKTIKEGYYFDGPGEDNALVFYPGAKVEETAYAPILNTLASQGVDCFLIKMPMKLAFFGKNKASSISSKYEYKQYYLAGHSLGGAMAANYAAQHRAEYSGLFLFAAYPTRDMTSAQFPVVFIYGDNDRIVDRQKLNNGFKLVPAGYRTVVIEGGNHACFGSYGEQEGDGKASIPEQEQWSITVDTILDLINSQNI